MKAKNNKFFVFDFYFEIYIMNPIAEIWQSWLNARDSKSRIVATLSRVRIPLSPPVIKKNDPCGRFFYLIFDSFSSFNIWLTRSGLRNIFNNSGILSLLFRLSNVLIHSVFSNFSASFTIWVRFNFSMCHPLCNAISFLWVWQ